MSRETIKKLVAEYNCIKELYKHTIIDIHLTKEKLNTGCLDYVYMIGDFEGQERGYKIERGNLRDYKFRAKCQSRELKYLKMRIKEVQRIISRENAKITKT